MLDAFNTAFALLATLDNIVAPLIAVVIGNLVGAIPGMTTPMAVALTLPFTFSLGHVTGILRKSSVAARSRALRRQNQVTRVLLVPR